MKRYLYFLSALLITMSVGCSNNDDTPKKSINIIGEWHCIPEEFTADIFVNFNDDSSFILYQKVGEGRYRHFTGQWEMKGNTLSGNYTDGTSWGSSYSVTSVNDDCINLTANNGSMEVMVYYRETIPESIKDESIEVRSTLNANYFGSNLEVPIL